MVGGEEVDHVAGQVGAAQGQQDAHQLAGQPGILDEHDLEQAVVQAHQIPVELEDAAHGDGICHRAEQELAVHHPVVALHAHADRLQAGKILNALQYVGQVSQQVLRQLGRGVGRAGEGPAGGGIDELAAVEAAQIEADALAVHRVLRGLHDVCGQAQAVCVVVGGSGGDVAHRAIHAALHQAGNGLVERAVAADADDALVLRSVVAHVGCGVAAAGGDVHRALVAPVIVQANDLRQVTVCALLPRAWVQQK